jgi:hypothetical protein
MSYLQHEGDYHQLVAAFLSRNLSVDTFVESFFAQWKADRDAQYAEIALGQAVATEEAQLCATLDQIFTACDCYAAVPENAYEINEPQLLVEVKHLSSARWQAIGA